MGAQTQTISISKHEQRETYYVLVEINETISSEFLIDTGSTLSIINEGVFDKLHKKHIKYVKQVKAFMADGTAINMSVYLIDKININGTCIIYDVMTAVVSGKARNILGLSALKKVSPFTISVQPPRLTLSSCIL